MSSFAIVQPYPARVDVKPMTLPMHHP